MQRLLPSPQPSQWCFLNCTKISRAYIKFLEFSDDVHGDGCYLNFAHNHNTAQCNPHNMVKHSTSCTTQRSAHHITTQEIICDVLLCCDELCCMLWFFF
eukprot:TRINITY_DN3887_c0_g1_i1.p1 TRINITY_DN3887_c0_g1~~TRINITY_DN3887_c0_g1_i1.p1  ORF type:complete len:99 (+),score=13.51 TRINITY_DN3887_c0_g1_i1:83-379(+)